MGRSSGRSRAVAGFVSLAVAGGAMLSVSTGPAVGGKVNRVKSEVTINAEKSGPDGAQGRLTAKTRKKAHKRFCERNRKVTLYRQDAMASGLRKGHGSAEKIGTTKTNRRGVWKLEQDLFAGSYIAKAHSKRSSSPRTHDGDDLWCLITFSDGLVHL